MKPNLTSIAIALAATMVTLPASAAITFYNNAGTFNSVATTSLIDDYETGDPRNTQLASLTRNGVTYTPFAGTPFPNVLLADPGYINFGAGVGVTTSSILTANGDENFRADFASAVTAVSFDAYWNGLGPATITVFDGSTILGSYSPSGNPNNKGFLGFLSDSTAITGFQWNTTLGGIANTGIDNLRTGSISGPIPEPETYAMLLAGLGLLATITRRKKQPK